jgi:hypothetical protein
MQENLEYDETDNCYVINGKIKIDPKYFIKINKKRNFNDLIKLEDNMWYYKNQTLIEILFDISNYKKIKFINNNTDDYRFNNIEITFNNKFNKPQYVKILEEGTPKIIVEGKCSGQHRNMYWKVEDKKNNKYYIMHIYGDFYSKISIDDINKVLNFSNIRPTWGISNDYIKTNIKIGDQHKVIYLHQYIMDVHFEDNSSMKKTVDHINRDKMDNRRENLRFANMSEQNSNRDKQKRQKNACELPNGIQQKDLPIHVCYHKRCYDKENNSWREFFTIDKRHPKLDYSWASSKSNNVTIKEKLDQIKLKLKHLNGEITDQEYKKLVEPEYKLFKGLRLSIDKKYNKYKFEYEDRTIKPCINYKMVLTHNDLQLMIDKFIDLLNDKYKENKEYTKMAYYKLEKPVLLDFSSVNNEIIEDDLLSETSNETPDRAEDVTHAQHTIHNSENVVTTHTVHNSIASALTKPKYTINPDLPANFLLHKEKECWYLSFNKYINTIRYNKKHVMKCMCIQTELDRLIDEINESFPNLNIEKYTVKNPYDFIDKTQLKENNKPVLPRNFSIYNGAGKDYIQFSKKINDKKVSYKTGIKSYDLQKELDTFVNYLNQEYKLNLADQKVVELNDWKTSNKIK